MAIKIKAGTYFTLPVIIEDDNFAMISAVEFVFTQTENGETLKSAYWSRDGESKDARQDGTSNTLLITFTRDDSYLFKQNATFCMDTRIHYEDSPDNPFTKIIYLTMNKTLFKSGEEVT